MKWLACLLLCGCANMPLTDMAMETDSMQYAAPLKLKNGVEVTITVNYVPRENMQVFCRPKENACINLLNDGRWIIYTEAPRSWNDSARLRRLGHEVLHALGEAH